MSRSTSSRVLFMIVSALLVVPLLTGGLVGARTRADDEDDFYEYLSVFTDVLSLVRKVYVERIDGRSLLAGALDGASDALDPFSLYVPAEEVELYRSAQRVGRGHSGMEVLKERGVAFVFAVEPGSPADQAGIERGDIVSKLTGKSTRDMPLWRIRQLLGSAPGTRLELELVRTGEAIQEELELAAYDPAAPSVETVGDTAVLRVARFDQQTPEQVARLLEDSASSRLLVDLRGVSGGDPAVGYQVADLFVDGELGTLVGRDGDLESFRSQRPDVWKGGEVGVLIDRGTQGPAEVLTRALEGLAAATVLGERSFGHAGRSAQVKLASGALLELTDAFYTGPGGERIDESIVPTARIDVIASDDEEGDPVLEEAIRLLGDAHARGVEEEKAAA